MNDIAHRLRESAKATFYDPLKSELNEAASHIEKLQEEIGVLFAANVRLNSRADLDSDGYVDRIKKLEAALLDLCDGWECCAVSRSMRAVARKALEGKDD